jgi:hypothetical protein
MAHGEWCPGNIISIAITENGEVWRLGKVPPCLFDVDLFL